MGREIKMVGALMPAEHHAVPVMASEAHGGRRFGLPNLKRAQVRTFHSFSPNHPTQNKRSRTKFSEEKSNSASEPPAVKFKPKKAY